MKSYSDYGARGIVVCEAWRDDFQQFLTDMGRRPKGMTIERKNNDGPYSPDNCVWASRVEQNNNKRKSRFVMVGGVRMNLPKACEAVGLPYRAVMKRVEKGLPESQWLEPLRKRAA